VSGKNKGRRRPTAGTVAAHVAAILENAAAYQLRHGPKKHPRPKPKPPRSDT
jgi:hypothetical protein